MTTHSAGGELLAWLAGQEAAMLELLRALVDIDTGSYDKEGVDRALEPIVRFLEAQGIAAAVQPVERHGDILRAELAGPGGRNDHVLLLGHRDTVFPKGEAAARPFTIRERRAYGPGVADMKAGLVMNLFVLAAFKRFGGQPAPIVLLVTSDEEIASPSSRPHIEAAARGARAVFNAEPGRPNGNIVSGRKGGVFLNMSVHGRAAHSGGAFEAGRSAIEALARKIVAMHALTDLERGTTVNVGLIKGGQSVNTVAPYAACAIDLRYVAPADRDAAVAAIQAIADTTHVPDTNAQLVIEGEFRPLSASPGSAGLLDLYTHSARDFGLSIEAEFSGGCADSGFTAAVGAPTLCAIGPVGGRGHTPEEYLEIDTLVPRAQAVAQTILRLA
jgi:glutamate carboxypeptidase